MGIKPYRPLLVNRKGRLFGAKFLPILFVFFIIACGRHPNENDAAGVVKNALSISHEVSAEKLTGGYSGSQLFLVSDQTKKYVVRFMKKESQRNWGREIHNMKIADENGYGPKIYFADPSKGIVIMEYLLARKITHQDFQNDQIYIELAHLLQKIHQGAPFENTRFFDPFKRIDRRLNIYLAKYGDYLPLKRVKEILYVIREAILPYRTTAPCHNDLNSGNLVFLGQEFKAIDYEDAGPGDPLYDVATVAGDVNPVSDSVHEKLLLSTYFGRPLSKKEEAIIYLMRQVVSIQWAFHALDRLPSQKIKQYEQIKVPSLKEYANEQLERKSDLTSPENNLRELKVLFNHVLANSSSQEFKNAMSLLAK